MDLNLSKIGIAVVGCFLASGGALAQSSGPANRPDFRMMFGFLSGKYEDTARNEVKNTSSQEKAVKVSGSEVQIAGAYSDFDAELTQRTITPSSVDYWAKRSELYLTVGYYWPDFHFVQPVVGYHQMTQSGDRDVADAPAAFIDKNTAFVLGLRSSFCPYDFGGHGPLLQLRQSYITSLEAKRNFGDERYLGLGYFFQTGRFKAALVAGQLRNFFNASKPSADDDALRLKVRHVYTANRIGLYIEY